MKIILTLNFSEDENQDRSLTSNTGNNSENTKPVFDYNKYEQMGDVPKYISKQTKQPVDTVEKQSGSTNKEDKENIQESTINVNEYLKENYGDNYQEVARDAVKARIDGLKKLDRLTDDGNSTLFTRRIKKHEEKTNSRNATPAGNLMKTPIFSPGFYDSKRFNPIFIASYVPDDLERFDWRPELEKKTNKGEISFVKHPSYTMSYNINDNRINSPASYKNEISDNKWLNLVNGYADPHRLSVNARPTEQDAIKHEVSHSVNLPVASQGLYDESGLGGMYLAKPNELVASMGAFRGKAAKQGNLIKTPEDFQNVLNQIKIGENGEGYWPNGERADSEVQRFLNTGRFLNWEHIKNIEEQDPEIWRKVVRNNNNNYQQLRRSYTGLPQRTHYA